MAVTTTNLGVITAYGDAVAAGYTGTKAEWQALMASYATVGQQAVDAKNAAVAAKDTAVSKATEATTAANTATTKAGEASASAQSIAQSAAQITQNTSDISELKEDFATMESDGVVPSADQILTDKGVTDSVPYHYRKTGGDGADRLYDQIVGGTVCFNQLVPNANKTFANTNTTDTRTYVMLRFIVGTSQIFKPIANVSTASMVETVLESPATGNGALIHNGAVRDFDLANYIPVVSGHKLFVHVKINSADPTTVGGISTDEQMIIDLTAMFGSTIADYIYQLEQTTAGAGVAFFKALFPNDYYPYNAGTLKSVEGLSAHKMVGFNQWDEEWEKGRISKTTGETDVGNGIRSKNFIHVMPNTEYYFRKIYANYSGASSVVYTYYDKNKTFLGGGEASTFNNFTTPSGAAYMKFAIPTSAAVVAYANDICINLRDPAKNGTYEPYEEHSYPLDSTLTLRGIPKLDANNNLYYDGDEYASDGTVTRKYGVVDLGTLNWTRNTDSNGGYYFVSDVIPTLKKQADNYAVWSNLIISKIYTKVASATIALGTSANLTYGGHDSGVIRIKDDSYTDATTFKTAMSGVMLVYELATPTTEEATPYQHLQQCNPNGTEEYVTTSIVPVGHVTQYIENLKQKLQDAPQSPTEDGDYIVRQTNGINEYVSFSSSEVIQNINEAVSDNAEQIDQNTSDISELKEEISDVCSKSLLNGYDKNSVEATNGYWRNTDGTFVASDNYTACNKYAEVKPNTEYSSWYSSGLDSRYTYVCFYDNQKNFISGSVLASSNIITSPANAKYVRVSSVIERVDTYVFCEGTTYNGYHDFGYFITLNDDVNVPNLQEVLEELETFEYTTTDSVGYMTYQGVIDTSQTSFVSKTTDNIPCKEGEIYEYAGDGRWSAYSYVIYNVNGSIIARGQIAGSDRITIPANAVSVKFSSFINATQAEEAPLTVRKISPLTLAEKVENNVYDIENLKSAGESLNGLKIDILGDSWSAVNDTASVKYTNLLASRDNMLVNVLAYSGSGFSLPTSANKPFYVQAQSIRADSDIVFIFGSFNDISAIVSGVQIGDVTDTGTSTICGCINTTIDNILAVNPFAKIIVATPGAWAGYNANGEGGNPNITRALEYVEAIKNVCFKRGYPCIDMLRTLNLKPWIEAFRTAYQPDGTHPNNDGHLKYVYPRVKAVLKEYGA